MRLYENLTPNLVCYDRPKLKNDQDSSYLERLLKRLLVYDQEPNPDFTDVVGEAMVTLSEPNSGFEAIFRNSFGKFIQEPAHLSRWQKIIKDYYYFTESETKRRNKDNPYYLKNPYDISSWDYLPDFSRQKRNSSYQFDHLYRDAQELAGQMHVLTKDYKQNGDKSLFRAKVNSLLVPNKVIFALNSSEHLQDFVEKEISLMNIKLSLDALKQAYKFCQRTIESLHQAKNMESKNQIENSIMLADEIAEKLRQRIIEFENKFMLYLSSNPDEF